MRFFDIVQRKPTVYWRKVFEGLGRLKGFLLRIPLVVAGSLTTELCISCHLFAKQVIRLSRRSGLLHTALYLKQCSVLLQQSYGGEVVVGCHPVMVKTTRTGLPVIIPAFHRKLIRVGDDRADLLVKMYLSWFSLGRIVRLARPLSWKHISSIDNLPKDSPGIREILRELTITGRTLLNRYLPRASRVPIHQGMRWVPTWKSVPNLVKHCGRQSIFLSVFKEIHSAYQGICQDLRNNLPATSSSLFRPMIYYAYDKGINELAASSDYRNWFLQGNPTVCTWDYSFSFSIYS